MTTIIACVSLILILVIVVVVIVVLAQLFPVRVAPNSIVDRLLVYFKGIDGSIWSTIFVLAIAVMSFFGLYVKSGIEEKELLGGLTAEVAGFIFDLILISLLVNYFAIRRQKKERIQRYHDLIDDFRRWRSEEARIRIFGAIKKLNELGVTKMNLDRIDLSKTPNERDALGYNLTGTSISGVNFSGRVLKGTVMNSVEGEAPCFRSSLLFGVMIERATLDGSVFNMAYLEDVSFNGTTFNGVASFVNAVLVRTTFLGCNAQFIDFDHAIVQEDFKKQIEFWGSNRKSVFGNQYLVPFKPSLRAEENIHDLSRTEGKRYRVVNPESSPPDFFVDPITGIEEKPDIQFWLDGRKEEE